MKLGEKLVQISIKQPKRVALVLGIITLLLGSLILKVHVDTDPENMLSPDEAVRLFHSETKKEFSLYDVVVLGVVNTSHPDGVFNPETLAHVYELTQYAATLSDPKHPERKVVGPKIISPSNVDAITQAGLGEVSFNWLMAKPPETKEEALRIRDLAMSNPLFKGTLVSEDAKAMGIYLPITSKDFAHTLSVLLKEKIASLSANGDEYYITGLPVAEDTFGKEMFVQMAIGAPGAMFCIFLLMLFFFRNLRLIISPLIVAMISVITTMGLLIGTGYTLHIMSSMIPIFLMPIAVVDSIHILSEFFDEYQATRDRRKAITQVVGNLFTPMLYTSLTSAAGFASLAITPIPPVQAFGIFVAIGIMIAWFATIIFIPAYIMLIPEESLKNFGVSKGVEGEQPSLMAKLLRRQGRFIYAWPKLIIIAALLVTGVAFTGIMQIQVNDNPVKWFEKNHEIRVADRVLNSHFKGTYEAFLILEADIPDLSPTEAGEKLSAIFKTMAIDGPTKIVVAKALTISQRGTSAANLDDMLTSIEEAFIEAQDQADDDNTYDAWSDILALLDSFNHRNQVFKRPDVLEYIGELQEHLLKKGVVGKTNSVTDMVKKIHTELFADPEKFSVPDSINGVAQCLISFQNSHKPDDLYHMVTPDFQKANIWIQLQNGDNKVMEALVREVEIYFQGHPTPVGLTHQWAGLTYLNVVWQEKMVNGMAKSFMSSFIVVLVMMIILFRSPTWGLLAMIPLSMTIAWIYGFIGLIGKDYDMPVAVLSSLTLGLAVDFAIHFLERARTAVKDTGSWKAGINVMFEEPARAISRNIIVIAIGFTPLLLAPLVPYQTVGVFLASIMVISGLATMFILPAIITIIQKWLFSDLPSNVSKKRATAK